MAETYRTTFKLRRGYSEVWERNNPVLQEGEPGFALDTKVLKIGDGVTPWLDLEGIDSSDGNESGYGPFYIATDYGISIEADDNSPALQALIDRLHTKGGGVIWFPVGTYRFRKSGADADGKEYAIVPKSNVSILGESMEGTILKQIDSFPYGMFVHRATADNPVVGCHFERFTVDAYETGDVNQVYGKAFHMKFVQNCVFRDLILRGTTATGMGVDFLDNVLIDRVCCLDCGRTWTGTEPGTSGIGIGTGGWENENFVISNCITVGCGQFGVFIENQTNLFGFDGHEYSKGCIISGCITRDGLNHGIGIRGGQNVTLIGCESYENAANGVYLDGKCRNVHIQNVGAEDNSGHGIRLNPDAESAGITIRGCSAVNNTADGIRVSSASDSLCIQGNNTRGNAVGLSVKEDITLRDCAIWGNVFLDGSSNAAKYSGNTEYIDVPFTAAQSSITLTGEDVVQGIKINPDGSEDTSSNGRSTGYLDVSSLGSSIRITTTGTISSVRVGQYDADKVSLVTDAEMSAANPLTVERLAGCVYIRIYYSSTGTGAASIESVVIEQG